MIKPGAMPQTEILDIDDGKSEFIPYKQQTTMMSIADFDFKRTGTMGTETEIKRIDSDEEFGFEKKKVHPLKVPEINVSQASLS